MQISAIVRGSLAGVVVALVMASILGWLDYQGWVSGMIATVLFWLGAGLSFMFAGLMAGRQARHSFWLHGALAALLLNLVGSVVAEAFGQMDGHLWLDLGFAAAVGLLGGISARMVDV